MKQQPKGSLPLGGPSVVGNAFLFIFSLSALTTLAQLDHTEAVSPSLSQKFRINDRTIVQELLNRGAVLIADYRAFQFLRVDESLAREFALRPEVEDASEQNIITLNARPLNTTTPEVQALRQSAGVFEGKGLHLIHFAGSVKPV